MFILFLRMALQRRIRCQRRFRRTLDGMTARHPFELFMLVVCLFAGIPTIADGPPAPQSIEALLPQLLVLGWGISLSVGAFIALLGIFLFGAATGIILEQVGLVMVGTACVFYGIAIWIVIGVTGAVSGGIVFGFGCACLWRWRQLQKLVNAAVAMSEVA